MKTTMQAKSHELNSLLRDPTHDDATTHNQESADKGLARLSDTSLTSPAPAAPT